MTGAVCRKDVALATALALLAGSVLFFRLGDARFYHLRNESRRAQIAREMLQTGNWVVPRLEGESILTKPPLFYWAVCLFSRDGQVSEFAARAPSVLAGVGLIVLTFLTGLLLFDRPAALTAALALLTTNFFLHQARYAELDALLAFFVAASLYCFLRGYVRPKRARFWFALCGAAMGLGMMTKGPFAVMFPMVPIVLFLRGGRELRLLLRPVFLQAWAWFLLICLPWPLVVIAREPDFLRVVLVETAGRVVTGFAHREPFYYYLEELVTALFPWVFVFPVCVWSACRGRPGPWRRPLRFALLWFAGNLLALSLLKSKRDYYLFAIMPAAALLVGGTWEHLWHCVRDRLHGSRWVSPSWLFVAGGLLIAASCRAGNPFAVNIPGRHFPEFPTLLLCAGAILVLTVLSGAVVQHTCTARRSLAAVVVVMLACHMQHAVCTIPIRNAFDSGAGFYRTAGLIAPEDAPLGICLEYENYTATFYAGRALVTLNDEPQVRAFMAAAGPRYLIVRGKHLGKIDAAPWHVAYSAPCAEHGSWHGLVLLCRDGPGCRDR